MKLFLTSTIFSMLLILNFKTSVSQENWQLELNKGGVLIYTRSVEGMNIKEFKAIANLNASPEEIEKIMKDIEGYTNWISDVKTSKILKYISKNEHIEYMRIAAPWPFDDRDVVNHFKIEHYKNKSFKVIITNKYNYIPEKEGVVRIKKSSGFWLFTPISEGKTQVRYQFLGDPGGEAPDWAANMFIVDGPYATLSKLKEITD